MTKRIDDAESFVRKALKSLGQEADDDTIRSAAKKVAKTIPELPKHREAD